MPFSYHPPPPPPPPPPPDDPPPPLPELEPGAVEDDDIAPEKELPSDEAKSPAEREEKDVPEYQAGE